MARPDVIGAGSLPPLAERNMVSVMRTSVSRAPDKIAVRDPDRALSYGALFEESLGIAGGIATLGVARQSPVLMMLDNHLDFVSAILGLGCTARMQVPVNTAYRGTILAHVINNSGATIMLVEQDYATRLVEIADALEHLETVIVRGDPAGLRLPRGIRVMALDDLPRPRTLPDTVAPWDIIGIMYTSGTTGLSKGALIPQAQAYGYAWPGVNGAAQADDVGLVALPLFHVTAQWGGVYNALIAGASSVVLPRFSATSFWDQVRTYGCTYSMMLGTVAQFLLNQPPRPDDRDHPLRKFGMAPVIPELEAFMTRFGVEQACTGYGSTEVGCVANAPLGTAVPGQAGWPRPGYDLRIVDDNDMDVPPGAVGEILIRAHEPWMTMAGYHRNPEATAKVWRNLWFHSGDRARMADNGQLIFIDRNNDAIRRKGENISSFEVEREVDSHPDVLESAAIAAPSDHADDELKACVVARPGSTLTPAALHAYLAARMPRFMTPRYIEIMPALPKTPTEKVRKADLRADALNPATWDCMAQPADGLDAHRDHR
ncbi:MAG: AMP-binding protein [Sphingobium sp.]